MYELQNNQYRKVLPLLKEAKWIFPIARAAIESKLGGKILVDDPDNPRTAIVMTKINWMFMFGNTDNSAFNAEFRDYISRVVCTESEFFAWCNLSAYWQNELKAMFGERVISYPRMPFRFNINKYLQAKSKFAALPGGFQIRKIDESLIKQACSFFPGILMFWDDYDNFLKNGTGFCILHEDEIVCACQSAVNVAGISEIDIFTSDKFRKSGLATHTCATFIDWCLANDLVPDWDCVIINQPSYNLAKKLGFEELEEYPLFFWHKDF